MAELRAGGLAVVIGCEVNGQSIIGHTVELIELSPGNSWVAASGQPRFFNTIKPRWLIHKRGLIMTLTNGGKVNGFAVILPEHLMPIGDDDFSHEKESEKYLQNANS